MRIEPEREIAYIEVQIRVLQDAGPHYRRNVGLAVARLQRRIRELLARQQRAERRRRAG